MCMLMFQIVWLHVIIIKTNARLPNIPASGFGFWSWVIYCCCFIVMVSLGFRLSDSFRFRISFKVRARIRCYGNNNYLNIN